MQKVFQDLDDYMFYEFRIFQATQARMYEGLNYSINSGFTTLVGLNCLLTVTTVGMLLLWFFGLDGERAKLSHIYGIILQLPTKVVNKGTTSYLIGFIVLISYN